MHHVMFNVFLIAFFIVISTMPAENALAQLVQTAEIDSDKVELSAQSLQNRQQQLQQQINEQENALADLLIKHGAEWDQLEAAQKGLENAAASFEKNNSKSNRSRLRNARFKSVLAKRNFNKITILKNELSDQTISLRERLNNTTRNLDTLNPRIVTIAPKNNEKIPPIIPQKLPQTVSSSAKVTSLEKKLTADEIRQVKAEKKAEILRLSALLEQRTENQFTSKRASKENPRGLPKRKVQKTPESKRNISEPIPTDAQTTVESADSSLATEAQLYSPNSAIKQLHSLEQVRYEELRLRRILSTKNSSHGNYNKMIIVKSLGKHKPKSTSNSYTLRTLGHDQYKAKIELLAGQNQLVIGFKRWSITVPERQQDHQYIVILDNSDGHNPQVTYFPQSLSSES